MRNTPECREQIHDHPSNPNTLCNRGVALLQSGEPQAAVEDFTQAIQLKPGFPEAYCNRGVAKMSLEDYAGAIEDLEYALLLFPLGDSWIQATQETLQRAKRQQREAVEGKGGE